MLEFKLVQGNRLRNAVGPLQHIRGVAAVFCNSETLYLQASDIDRTIVALLRFRSGFFNRYVINRKAMAGVGVLALGSILETMDDEDSITVRADCRSNIIDFTFEDVETHETRNTSADIVNIPRDHVEFDDSSYEYEVVVGVPSAEFRRIFASLRNSGPGGGSDNIELKYTTIICQILLTHWFELVFDLFAKLDN
ncbi:proliferating cell nuclear antigen-like [Rhododendron vialii]|uniref:proliferating cell nuclear antigen-like n=1 Tax=Rhododendron vialii TaxID=182163 RepID=UPI00265EBBCE|nr:proliferating cell nuclear antigen-like [Rhododendron vialii]